MKNIKLENRQRCLKCPIYERNICLIMSNADVFEINNCILENDEVKNLKENTPEIFMFKENPLLFLTYLNYKKVGVLPKIGTKVVTLKAGFSGYAGSIRYISKIDDKYIYLSKDSEKEESISCSKIETWYQDIFEI